VVVAAKEDGEVLGVGRVVAPGYIWRDDRTEARHSLRVEWDDSATGRIPALTHGGLDATIAVIAPHRLDEVLGPLVGAVVPPPTTAPRWWVFQSNPGLYDLSGALRDLKGTTWRVTRFADEIREGDRVFLWQAGEAGGIRGLSTVSGGVTTGDRPADPYVLAPDVLRPADRRVELRFDEVYARGLPRERVRETPGLEGLDILRAPQGTNFKLSATQAERLVALLREEELVPPPTFQELLDDLRDEGLFFTEETVANFLLALQAKRFVILTGISGTGKTQLALALAKRFPLREWSVEESVAEDTFDTPENRFVKASLDLCAWVIDRMRAVAATGGRSRSFRNRLLTDCHRLDAALLPVRRHGLWLQVGPMTHFPATSTVLHRRSSYRAVFGHYSRMRLGARLPLDPRRAEALLEVKDIAQLYELWSCFALIGAVAEALGPPARVDRPRADSLEVGVPWEYRAVWADGTALTYSPSFSRSRSRWRHSYSVPLRPDLALRVPPGRRQPGLHLFDAKFRVDWLDSAAPLEGRPDEDDVIADEERVGVFKRADLYKMHAYRDALPGARSAWILYPGSALRFYPVAGVVAWEVGLLPDEIDGVGAVPLGTEEGHAELDEVVRRLL
jgi:hypothetical protein